VVLLKEAQKQADADLVVACQSGDATAFDALMARHRDRLYTVVYRIYGPA